MAKGRDKQGREKKKAKKAKDARQPGGDRGNVEFRHHSVVMNQPETPRISPE